MPRPSPNHGTLRCLMMMKNLRVCQAGVNLQLHCCTAKLIVEIIGPKDDTPHKKTKNTVKSVLNDKTVATRHG